MAIPYIDWEYWNQPAIEPKMRVVAYFPSGTVTFTDEDLSSISFDSLAFDSSSILFGSPIPSEGTITFVDYEQKYNPVYNKELQPNIEMRLFLGLRGFVRDSQLGPNLVTSKRANVQVIYEGSEQWAIPFNVSEPLKQDTLYRMTFDYELPDGTTGVDETIGTVGEVFHIPDDWPANKVLALTFYNNPKVSNLSIQEVFDIYEPYGVFLSQDWTYDTNTHSASVNIIDKMSEQLSLDNRPDAHKPASTFDLKTFAIDLLELYEPVQSITSNSWTLPYAFYAKDQSTTVANLVTALGAWLFFLPDGTQVLCEPSGFYETGIVLTDDDVESYSIEQTSAVTWDAAAVEALLPYASSNTSIVTLERHDLINNGTVELSTDNLLSIDYAKSSSALFVPFVYSWNVAQLTYKASTSTNTMYDTFQLFGTVISSNTETITNTAGTSPYTVSGNVYIQTKKHAQYLVDLLDSFLDLPYRNVTVQLRGCYGFWPGAKLSLDSSLYGIKADYVIIALSFSYTGAVSTKITLQRII